jgi:hypothetical protein
MIDTKEIDDNSATLDYLVKALTGKLTRRDKAIAIDHVIGTIIAYRAMRSKRVKLFKRNWFLTEASK